MQLVYIEQGKKDLYTLSTIIAECAEVQHHTVTKLIDTHKTKLEQFGVIRFKIDKPKKGTQGGRPTKDYMLNEQQATLLITFMQNTKPVVEFKLRLVKEFYEMKEELTRFKIARALEKPQRRKLTDAIKEWEHANTWSYKHVTDLLFKATTGMNAKKLKANRNISNALDSLTADELERYSKLENAVIALIDLQKSYDEVRIFISEN